MTGAVPAGRVTPSGSTARASEAAAAGLDALLRRRRAPTCATSPATSPCRSSGSPCSSMPAAAGAPVTLIAPRLEATPARTCAAAAAGGVDGHDLGGDRGPDARSSRRPSRPGWVARPPRSASVAVSDGLRAAFVLGLQRVLPRRARSRSRRRCCARSGCARTPTRSRCCGAAAHGRRPGHRRDRRRAARRSHRGRRRARGPRAAARRGPRGRRVLRSSPSGPNSASPHHDAGRAGDPRAASRSCSTSAGTRRRLRLATSRARSG